MLISEFINHVTCGNALDVLKALPSDSVDCVVTSPPYWSLRAYGTNPQVWDVKEGCEHDFSINHHKPKGGGMPVKSTSVGNNLNVLHFESESSFCSKCGTWKGELGLEPTFQLYIKHLCDIFDEIKRVLKNKGTCWVNIGDTYSGSGNGTNDYRTEASKSISGKRFDYNMMFQGKQQKKFQNLPDKCLCQIPSRFAIEMTNREWILRNRLIWHKPNCMPSSVKDRFTVDYEDLFFFVKSKKYYFETQYESHKSSINEVKRQWSGGKKETQYATNKEWSGGVGYGENGRNKRCVWTITTKPFKEAHFATFPEALIKTPIKAGCPKDGIVLDPFCGAGTTGVVAKKLGRNFILIDLNKKYCEISRKRLNNVPERLTKFTKFTGNLYAEMPELQ